MQAKSKKKQKQELKASKTTDSKPIQSNSLQAKHITIEAKSKFQFLFSLLKRLLNKRVKIFVSTPESTEYFKTLLKETGINLISNDKTRFILLDNKAEALAPVESDYCILYDPPKSQGDYEAMATSSKETLLCLLPNEEGLVGFFNSRSKRVNCTSSQISSDVTKKLERLANTNYEVYSLGRQAYKAFLVEYITAKELNAHRDIEKLAYDKIGVQFGSFNPIAFNLDKLNG